MSVTMSTMNTPSSRTVLREQFALVQGMPHKEWIVVALLAVLMMSGALNVKIDMMTHQLEITGLTLTYIFALPCAALWALGIWFREGPSRRDYHWAMPVERRTHALLRVAAGAGWFLLALVAVLFVGTIVALVWPPASLGTVAPPLVWFGFLVGPLAVYLFSSTAALVSDRPVLWVLVGATALKMGWITAALRDAPMLREFIGALAFGPNSLSVRMATQPGPEAIAAWIVSLVAWLAVAAGAVWLAAGRRGE